MATYRILQEEPPNSRSAILRAMAVEYPQVSLMDKELRQTIESVKTVINDGENLVHLRGEQENFTFLICLTRTVADARGLPDGNVRGALKSRSKNPWRH